MSGGGGKRRGRPRDPTCGADPADLVRHPLLLAEPDDERARSVARLVGRARYPRPSRLARSVAALDEALADDQPLPCVLVDANLARESNEILAIHGSRRTLPMVVTERRSNTSTQIWCLAHRLVYLPGALEPADVEWVLDDAEAYEAAPLPHRAWLVRRAGERAVRHEVSYTVDLFHGVDEGRRLKRSSRYSVRSRAALHFGVASLEALRDVRKSQWKDRGRGGPPPWSIV